jgi:hypothetical protein
MNSDLPHPVVPHTHRGLRWQLISFALSVATAAIATVSARSNRLAALLILLCGIGVWLGGRSFRASGALLHVVQPPRPRWIPWAAALSFGAGALMIGLGALLLAGVWRAAP